MGFDGKTPKPGEPKYIAKIHEHQYFDYSKNKWVAEKCSCATGRYHTTKKER